MIKKISVIGCAAILTGLASGATVSARTTSVPGPVPATVNQIIDGDTIEVEAYIWPDQWIAVHVRIRGIDTPEIHGFCDFERQQAQAAKEFATLTLSQGKATLTDISFDKYGGRVVANVITPKGENLGGLLIAKGLARPYSGGHKSGWCPTGRD